MGALNVDMEHFSLASSNVEAEDFRNHLIRKQSIAVKNNTIFFQSLEKLGFPVPLDWIKEKQGENTCPSS